MKLAGSNVVITGAANGIGRETAKILAEKGARIYAIDVSKEGLASLSDDFSKYGHTLIPCLGSVTDTSFLASVRDLVKSEGKTLDVWINNAGIAKIRPFLDTDADEFQKVLDINLGAVINGTRIALECMETQGRGLIVNIGSVAGYLPAPLMSSYNASKFAVTGFTKSLQAELRLTSSPVRMMLVSPGFADTNIVARGQEHGFPNWLSFMLSSAKDIACDIVNGIIKDRAEINPTLNGKLMRKMYAVLPETTVRSSKLLLTKSLKDLWLQR